MATRKVPLGEESPSRRLGEAGTTWIRYFHSQIALLILDSDGSAGLWRVAIIIISFSATLILRGTANNLKCFPPKPVRVFEIVPVCPPFSPLPRFFYFLFASLPLTEMALCQSPSLFGQSVPPPPPPASSPASTASSLHSLHGLVLGRPPFATTAAAVGPPLPQFSIKTPNLNGAFKPRPAPALPLPASLLSHSAPTLPSLALFSPFKPNGHVQGDVPAHTLKDFH